jgi:hypothetical protein
MMNIPTHILDRLLILNPALEHADAQRAIEALYKPVSAEWMPANVREYRASGMELRENFNIPRLPVTYWQNLAATGTDVCPAIDAWLDEIGVTRALLDR